MGPEPARITGGVGGNHQDGAPAVPAVPAAGLRGRAGMFVLAAGAGLALASGAATGTPAAHAAAAAAAHPVAAARALPEVEPCPCADPPCRPVCFQSMASGGPASGPSQALTADLLTAALPATTAGTGGGDPKIPEFVGD